MIEEVSNPSATALDSSAGRLGAHLTATAAADVSVPGPARTGCLPRQLREQRTARTG
ncbi:hypothetical protein ONA92_21105 [Mycobacteroides salmoniphilum]|uniref:hypothetical protein n=1 Tax=Mycobacteroides salmoniphilum TaxID=404941 RepID=UPI003562EE51